MASNPYLSGLSSAYREATGKPPSSGSSAQAPTAPETAAPAEGEDKPTQYLDYNAPITPEEAAEIERRIGPYPSNGSFKERVDWEERRAQAEQQIRAARASSATSDFYEQSQELAERLGEGGYEQERYHEYEKTLNEPVERDFYDQAQSVSAYLARQGLGGSGINISSHQGLAQNKNAVENQGRSMALEMARNAKRQEILDEFSTKLSAMGPVLQKYGIDVNMFLALKQMQLQSEMAEDQRDMAMWQGLGGAAGMAIGGLTGNPALFAAGAGGYTNGGMGQGVPPLEYID